VPISAGCRAFLRFPWARGHWQWRRADRVSRRPVHLVGPGHAFDKRNTQIALGGGLMSLGRAEGYSSIEFKIPPAWEWGSCRCIAGTRR